MTLSTKLQTLSGPDRDRQDWMNDEHWRCALVAAAYKHGFHHCMNLRQCGKGVAIDEVGEVATYDFDGLARLVVLAHDECVRVGISQETREVSFEGHTYNESSLVITFHPRKRDGEKSWMRHPTLEEAALKARNL